MDTYVIVRRRAWQTRDAADEALERAAAAVEQLTEIVAWRRSYIVEETNGTVGSICLYEAASPEAVRRHSARAGLPIDEILKVADTLVVRPDPAAVTA